MTPLLTAAQSFFDGITSPNLGENCYWYGWANTSGGMIVPNDGGNPCGCRIPPPLPLQTTIGWQSDAGYALIGTDTSGGATRYLALTDCSGFAAYLLAGLGALEPFVAWLSWYRTRNGEPEELQQIDKGHPAPFPSAADYAFVPLFPLMPDAPALPFTIVAETNTLADALRNGTVTAGQLLAYSLPPGSTDTGHIMVIDAVTQTDTNNWDVTVYDASSLAHKDDVRPGGTGVGRGTISLQVTQTQGGAAWTINFDRDSPKDTYRPIGRIAALALAAQH